MTGGTQGQPSRDFTDSSILRGSAVAIIVGYFMAVVVASMWIGRIWSPLDMARGVSAVSFGLRNALHPATLAIGLCAMAVLVVIGYFVMAAYRGDHTTHAAAAIIGARTAAIGFAILLFFASLLNLGGIVAGGALSALPAVGVLFVLTLGAGAVTGLAARIAAGPPTVMREQQAD